MTLLEKMQFLGPKEYINCFLVTKKVRDGFLFQTIDYNEYDINSPISKKKLNSIKEYFPSLKQTPNKQGVLLSEKEFSLKDIEDTASLGKILGYQCESLTKIFQEKAEDSEIPTDTVHIIVNLMDDTSITIISFMCININDKMDKINELVSKIRKALKEENEMKKNIKNVELNIEHEYTPYYLIKLLSNYEKNLTEDEKNSINANLDGIGFSEPFRKYINNYFQYNNPIHRGIMIGLLTYAKYPLLQPFYPLQNYGKDKPNEVNIQTINWETFLHESLELSFKKNGRKKKSKKKSRKKKSRKNKTKKRELDYQKIII